MSPLNRGPLLGHRVPPAGVRLPPPPRFGGRLPPPGMPPRMPPPPMGVPPPMFGLVRQRIPPPLPPRPGAVPHAGGPMSLYSPRGRGIPPLVPPMAGVRGTGPRGPPVRPWPRAGLPPQGMPHMRPRFPIGNGNIKSKVMNNTKKINKLEELELKKPWMTDEIRNEIQKKNKLYAKAKKNKDAKEWEEFKDLRNKVTRMIRDAKNEYLAKNPEQADLYKDVEPYDDSRDENYISSEEEKCYYCEVCDKEFASEELLSQHNSTHKICGIDGCTFSAHPLLVDKHVKMQHSTGLYQRMKNLSTPDDIEKWKNERKRKYPTKANVELKKAQEMEKKERGEIINEVQSKAKRKTQSRDKRRKPRKRYNAPNNAPQQSNELYRGLCAFPGIACLAERNINEVEDDIDDKPCETNVISDEEEILDLPSTNKNTVSLLPNLVANYGSDSEEDDGPEEVPIKKTKLEEIPDNITESVSPHTSTKNLEAMPSKNSSKDESTSGNNKTKSSQVSGKKAEESKQNNYRNRYNVDRLQLLQKLLSRPIQHERNVICQCIKYIVDNNFFDKV